MGGRQQLEGGVCSCEGTARARVQHSDPDCAHGLERAGAESVTLPRRLADRYDVGEVLGFGGMSEVHLARDVSLNRDVAVKVLRADLARDPGSYLRFRREAQNAAALNFPAIVAVYDTGVTDTATGPLPYIVMEYVDGLTLGDIVDRDGPMKPLPAIEVVADVCAALEFSHQHAIVHRDVKPANIMITAMGAVKVMDFGIARTLTATTGARFTQTAAVLGSAHYLSPEQARGEAVDERSDVYSLGCVLYELLTGDPPFRGDSPVAVAYQHVREDPVAPTQRREGISAGSEAVVLHHRPRQVGRPHSHCHQSRPRHHADASGGRRPDHRRPRRWHHSVPALPPLPRRTGGYNWRQPTLRVRASTVTGWRLRQLRLTHIPLTCRGRTDRCHGRLTPLRRV